MTILYIDIITMYVTRRQSTLHKRKTKKRKRTRLHKSNHVYIIDFANLMHILYNYYQNLKDVITKFYRFLYVQLQQKNVIYLIAKPVTLGENTVDLPTVFQLGKQYTHLLVDPTTKLLQIFNLTYPFKVTSGLDDLVFWLVTISVFKGLIQQGYAPRTYLHVLTNDKQYLNKIIFQLSDEEIAQDFRLPQDLRITTLDSSGNALTSPAEKDIKKSLGALVSHKQQKHKQIEPMDLENTIKNILPHIQDFAYTKVLKTAAGLNSKQLYVYAWIKYIQVYLYGDFYGSLPQDVLIHFFT